MIVLGTFAVALAAVALGMRLPDYAGTEDDSMLVYCLSPSEQTSLSDAAVALGFAVRDHAGAYMLRDGGTLDPASWHRGHPDDFIRTCEALFAVHSAPEPGVFGSILPFLTGLFGAVLAFSAATWRDRVSRGRTLADDLRSSFEGFREAAEPYLKSQGPAEVEEMVERRGPLLIQLARAKAAHPGWTTVCVVEKKLTAVSSRSIARDLRERKKVTVDLDAIQAQVFKIANALEQPMRPHPAMHDRSEVKR